MPPPRPAVVAFDVNETLFSLDRVGREMTAWGLDQSSLQVWFGRVLRDGIALALTGDYRRFRDLGATHLARLRREAGLPEDPEHVLTVLARFRELRPYQDVEPAFRRLRGA